MKKGPDPRILDDIARVAGGAVNIVSGLGQQLRDDLRSRANDVASRMDLVPREELERAQAQIGALRVRIDGLEDRIARLEGGRKTAKEAPAAKPAKAVKKQAKAPQKKTQSKKGGKA